MQYYFKCNSILFTKLTFFVEDKEQYMITLSFPSSMRSSLLLSAVVCGTLLLPLTVSAHEHRTYQIGDKQYNITVGSINEPIHVDDKSGVEVSVSAIGSSATTASVPVTGLEQTLRVEVIAGTEKETFDLHPRWGEAGSYEAVFYPTVATTYQYRLFGIINGVDVNLVFVCKPSASEESPNNTASVKVSDGVTQTSKGGAFSCPEPRQNAEFPTVSASAADMAARIEALEKKNGTTNTVSIALGAVAIALALTAIRRTRR